MPEGDGGFVADRGVDVDRTIFRKHVAAQTLHGRAAPALAPLVAADEEVPQVGAEFLCAPESVTDELIPAAEQLYLVFAAVQPALHALGQRRQRQRMGMRLVF